jgi:polyisoprenoid-binding protein YceI
MATFKIDPAHSDIQFKVKHLMITNVTGSFGKFDATLEAGKDDFSDAKASFEADIDSITTGNEQRDGHLKGEEFFAAAEYPKLSFVSTGIQKLNNEDYKLTGDLTVRGVTKPITLDVTYNGTVVDPYGQTKAGFEATGKINRKDFGLNWSAVTEAGGLVVSDEVKLSLNVQLIKQA